MLYKIKVGKETISVMANSQASAEAWVKKKHGTPGDVVEAPEYPEVEVSATPMEEIETVEDTTLEELADEWDELDEDETDSSDT